MVHTFLVTAASLVFWELVKQAGVQLTRRHVPTAVAEGLVALDRLLPRLLAEGVAGAELEDRLRQQMGALTGSDWSRIRRTFDVQAFLDRNAAG